MMVLDPSLLEADHGDGRAEHPDALCVALGAPMEPVQLVAQYRVDALIAVHRAALADLVAVTREPAVDVVGVGVVSLRPWQPTTEPEEGLFAPIADLEIHGSRGDMVRSGV